MLQRHEIGRKYMWTSEFTVSHGNEEFNKTMSKDTYQNFSISLCNFTNQMDISNISFWNFLVQKIH